jgi:hypothetical protein
VFMVGVALRAIPIFFRMRSVREPAFPDSLGRLGEPP